VTSLKGFMKLGMYAPLVRFRLSLAVTFSAATGYFIFNGRVISLLPWLVSGVFLLAAGASALNQVVERNQDKLMQRTKARPLPLEKISPVAALIFSICLLASGIAVLLFTGITPALLGVLNVLLYNLLYTTLKRITSLAVFPGAAVGAIPPIIGYTAAGGTILTTDILLFSGFMFLWQLPHFWLIIMKHREDYRKAGFITFPKRITEKQIKNLIFLWTTGSTVMLFLCLMTGLIFNRYLTLALLPLNILFVYLFHRMLYQSSGGRSTRAAFILVNSFGLLVMVLFIINAFL
jgi:protoheme IX farnesyltransferase